jgi:hypothetical protein
MRSRLLRSLLTLVAFVAAWLVVSPALAAQASGAGQASEATAPGPASLTSQMSRVPATRLFGQSRRAANASSVPASLAPPRRAPESVPPGSRAPLCDPRGATTFAPPPQMQDVEVSLDTGLTADDCLGAIGSARAAYSSRGRAPLPIDASSASSDAAVITAVAALAASGRELLPAPVASATRARPGIRSTVDRPPRA